MQVQHTAMWRDMTQYDTIQQDATQNDKQQYDTMR